MNQPRLVLPPIRHTPYRHKCLGSLSIAAYIFAFIALVIAVHGGK